MYRHVTWVLILLGLIGLAGSGSTAGEIPTRGAIHVITVHQAITPATMSYIEKSIERASASRAEMLIVQLDTPGGLLEATRQIVQAVLNSPVPVVVYIAPAGARGASAGTIIMMASHVAAMAPATHIGAAHPVSLFGGGDNKVMGEKILNDTSAFIESIAELRGRNVEWAISSVRESKSITARKALELNVVELIAEDLDDLLKQLDGRQVRMSKSETVTLSTTGRPLIFQEMTFSQEFMSLVSNPNLIFLLLIVGLVGLYIELSNPGLYLPGIVGAISLIMALIAMQTLPISYGALGLLLLGVALLVAESFIPSFGILGIGGLTSLLMGSIFLMDESRTELRVDLPVILSAVATVGVISLVIGRLLVKSLSTPPRSFQANLVGQAAEVRERIRPGKAGTVFINGEIWKATANASLNPGAQVEVVQVEGLMLHVGSAEAEKPAKSSEAS